MLEKCDASCSERDCGEVICGDLLRAVKATN